MKVTEYVDRKRDITKEDLQAIAEWDSRFSQIKKELAKKDTAFSDLNDVANWNYKPRRYAIKAVRGATSLVDEMAPGVTERGTTSLYIVGCLFVKEAASRIFEYYKRRNALIAPEAKQYMSAYSSSK